MIGDGKLSGSAYGRATLQGRLEPPPAHLAAVLNWDDFNPGNLWTLATPDRGRILKLRIKNNLDVRLQVSIDTDIPHFHVAAGEEEVFRFDKTYRQQPVSARHAIWLTGAVWLRGDPSTPTSGDAIVEITNG
jgi:hypothetical protein